jgi:hypothetical protein
VHLLLLLSAISIIKPLSLQGWDYKSMEDIVQNNFAYFHDIMQLKGSSNEFSLMG